MTIGPAPMMRIDLMSARLGIGYFFTPSAGAAVGAAGGIGLVSLSASFDAGAGAAAGAGATERGAGAWSLHAASASAAIEVRQAIGNVFNFFPPLRVAWFGPSRRTGRPSRAGRGSPRGGPGS